MKKYLLIFALIFFPNISFADQKMDLGLEVYQNKAQCGTCHSLKAAGSTGDIGPNLDILKPQIANIIYAVTYGVGVMPPWADILTAEEIEAVAYYVFSNTSK